jgi:hypothetical protein
LDYKSANLLLDLQIKEDLGEFPPAMRVILLAGIGA